MSGERGLLVDGFDDVAAWRGVDDRVMGGVSRSAVVRDPQAGCAVFTGEVSSASGGGFAAVRRPLPPGLLAGAGALRLRLCSDGRHYRVNLAEHDGGSAEVWRAALPATDAGVWTTVEVPFAALLRSYRGRVLPGAEGLRDAAAVRSIGLSIGAGQLGTFRLELAWIRAV